MERTAEASGTRSAHAQGADRRPRPFARAGVVGLVAASAVLGACSDGRSAPTTIPSTTAPRVVSADEPSPTTTAERPIEAAAAPCTVSEILVPSCGAWIGTSVPALGDRLDTALGLDQYRAAAGQIPDIIHLYKRDGEVFPTAEEVALSQQPGEARSLLFYNWKPSTAATWREVADGVADHAIRAVAAGLRNYPHKLFLSVHHEPENDLRGPGSGMTAPDYVDMYRHTVGLLRKEGVTNAVLVMNYMGFAGWADVVDDLWPGHDVVDWIAYDPYGHRGDLTLIDLLDRAEGTWPGFYTWATDKAPGTPIMLGEWGFDSGAQVGGASILDGAPERLAAEFPMIKALIYWNSIADEYNYRLDVSTPVGRKFAAAYAAFVSHRYFSATDRALAP